MYVAVAFADPDPVVVADTDPVLEPEEDADEVISEPSLA
jgi:hypothetical protein